MSLPADMLLQVTSKLNMAIKFGNIKITDSECAQINIKGF